MSVAMLFWPNGLFAAQPAARDITDGTFVTSDGVRLHFLESGPVHSASAKMRRTPVIAFIPGWGMPAKLWQRQLAGLGARFPVAALDPRGQGLSESPAHGFSIGRRAEDVGEFIARYRNVVLVGWSLGALEALHYIGRFGAGNVTALVIVDSSIGEGPEQAAPAPGTGFIDELRRDRAGVVEAFVRAIFRRPLPEEEIAALRDGVLRMPLEASLSLFPSDVPRAFWRRAVHAYPRPLLYVVTPQFADQAATLGKNRPGTRVAIFRDAGHALFVDEPQRFNRLLADFVAANNRGS